MSESGSMEVRRQVQLSFRKSFNFCRKGISYRLFRSSMTLAVVVVAVAFFMALLSESMIVQAVGKGVAGEVKEMREADLLLNHLFYPHASSELSRMLAGGQAAHIEEFARVTGISPDAAATLANQCRRENAYLSFFANMAMGKRLILVKKNKGRAIFAYLAVSAQWDEFARNLAKMRTLRLPTEIAELQAFVAGWPAYVQTLEAARGRWIAAAASLQTRLRDLTQATDVTDWMAGASDAEVEQWRQAVVAAGFSLSPEVMARVRKRLAIASCENRISRLLQTDEGRAAWKQAFLSLPGLEEQLLLVTDPRADALLKGGFSAEQRAMLVSNFARARKLRVLEAKLPAQRMTTDGQEAGILSGSALFLVIISFVVCMVGITNAMLMAITERFREIATMKCLGATDGFILNQFLIEAAIQGIVGGMLGMVTGLLVTLVKSTVLLGASVFVYFPVLPLLLAAVVTVTRGVLLSMLASIYPARAASAMAPMDAMRVE